MAFAKTYGAQTHMLAAHMIAVETDVSRGLYAFSIVGLPDKAVEESRDRVCAAIKNSGFESPKERNQKALISLAPADLKKEGPSFDVPIALSYLLAQKDVVFNPEGKLFIGELSLDGAVREARGVLPLVMRARDLGFTEAYVPCANADEAALVDGIAIYAVRTLRELIEHLDTKRRGDEGARTRLAPRDQTRFVPTTTAPLIDLKDVRGQESAKRALEIAAAGGHNIALWGPPGTGKTLLAKALCGIMPPLTFEEMLEVTSIHSVAGALLGPLVREPPFRSPHHTSSYVSLVGGGTVPKPGELTLAHRGILFLDEFPEFERRVIEALRQPLEDKIVSVARARGSSRFPADVILVAALNPCPCGNWGNAKRACVCTPQLLARYARKLSGPIVDRIDLWIEVAAIDHDALAGAPGGESSEVVRARVMRARATQRERFAGTPLRTNSDMSVKEIDARVPLADDVRRTLNASATKLDLSARAYHRIIKLARTIADVDGDALVGAKHILEALRYRPKAFGI